MKAKLILIVAVCLLAGCVAAGSATRETLPTASAVPELNDGGRGVLFPGGEPPPESCELCAAPEEAGSPAHGPRGTVPSGPSTSATP